MGGYCWTYQHWSPPKLHELTEPYNQTLLELRMIDLFPTEIIETLRDRFGKKFEGLNEDERVALALAASEGTVNHARLCSVSSLHPVNLSREPHFLTQLGMLSSQGSGSEIVYFLTGEEFPTPDDVFRSTPKILKMSPSDLTSKSSATDQNRDAHGYLHADQLTNHFCKQIFGALTEQLEYILLYLQFCKLFCSRRHDISKTPPICCPLVLLQCF
jgi:hypothetical protein